MKINRAFLISMLIESAVSSSLLADDWRQPVIERLQRWNYTVEKNATRNRTWYVSFSDAIDGRESQPLKRSGRAQERKIGRNARLRIPPRDELFTSVENLTHHFDVVYGNDDSKYQVLDAWLVKSDAPGPVLLQFHAGGYIGGNKSEFVGRSSARFEAFLKAGISLVSCHYRLAPQYPFPAPLHDAARAVQFVRSKAKAWNIDADRIAVIGGSAGGQLAAWAGLAPDLADPDSDDPVARQSSRVTCFIGCGPLYFTNIRPLPVQVLRAFKCAQNEWDDPGPELQDRIDYATPETHLSSDDPPGMLHYMKPPFGLKKDQDFTSMPVPDHWEGPHDTWHGIKLARKMREAGVEVEAVLGHTASTKQQLAFLKKHFDMK